MAWWLSYICVFSYFSQTMVAANKLPSGTAGSLHPCRLDLALSQHLVTPSNSMHRSPRWGLLKPEPSRMTGQCLAPPCRPSRRT